MLSLPAVGAAAADYRLTDAREIAASDALKAQMVRSAYERLAAYEVAPGHSFSVAVDVVGIYEPHELSGAYADYLDLPGDAQLQTTLSARTDFEQGREEAALEPAWTPYPALTRDQQAYAGKRFSAALRDVEADSPHMKGAIAHVALYRVTLEADGVERSYRASAFWSKLDPRTDTLYVAYADPVIPNVDLALTYRVPPEGLAVKMALGPAAASKLGCATGDRVETLQIAGQPGTWGHVSGSHVGSFTASATCTCNTACTSTCTATPQTTVCQDTGARTGGWHVMRTATDASSTLKQSATSTGAQCAAAFSCAMKFCTFPACAFTIGVSVNGVSGSFQNGDAVWAWNRTANFECGACEQMSGQGTYETEHQDWNTWGGAGGGWNGIPVCTYVSVTGQFNEPMGGEFRCW